LPDWPALWSHSNINADEIDEMEGLETLGQACYHIHPPTNGPGACLSGSYAGAWHKYASEWEPGVVKIFYDGAQVGELSSAELNGTPQYLIADMVPPGCCNQPLVVPDEMTVNYVRVWQKLPIVTTGAATGKQPLQATLNGSVNSNGTPLTNCHFDYGTSTSYGSSAPCSGPESGESATVSLTPGTTYHFRIDATNGSGTSYGNDETFSTPGPVEAVTGEVTSVQEEQATLNGTVNPNGYPAKYYFQYGETASYGSSTPEGEAGGGGSPVPESPTIARLTPGMTYHYRLVGTSGGVTSYGGDRTFKTLSAPSLVVANGTISAATQDVNSALFLTTRNLGNGTWQSALLGEGSSTTYSSPSAVTGPSGEVWVAAEGPGNALWVGVEGTTGTWTASYHSGTGSTYSAPAIVIDPSGDVLVFAQGSKNSLVVTERVKSTGSWEAAKTLVSEGVNSAPSAVAWSGGEEWVAFRGPKGEIWDGVYSGGKWTNSYSSPENLAESAPSEVIDPSGDVWFFFEGPEHKLRANARLKSTGAWGEIKALVAEDYSAPSAVAWSGGEEWVAFEGPKDEMWDGFDSTSGVWSTNYKGPEGSAYSAPSEIIDSSGAVWVAAQGAGNTLDIKVRNDTTGEWGGSYEGG
jgi:hypothetical protein